MRSVLLKVDIQCIVLISCVFTRRGSVRKKGLAGLLGLLVLPVFAGNAWIGPVAAQTVAVGSGLQAGESLDRSAVFGREELRKLVKNRKKGPESENALPVSFLVIGEVNCPGEFDLPAPVSLVDALAAAGGPSAGGSLRKIQISRAEKLVCEADLYDFLVPGRPVPDFCLAEGDVVSVQAGGSLVKVTGQTERTGVFEVVSGEMTLEKILQLAGGFNRTFSACKVEILRVVGGYKRVFFTMDLTASEKIPPVALLDGDEVRISECRLIPEDVFLAGHCHKTEVVYTEGMRLSEILTRKILKEDTALEYGEVLRKTSGPEYEEVLGFVPDQLLQKNLGTDISLRPGDKIVLFSKKFLSENPVVTIEGMVARPGRFVLEGETDIRKAIMMAGGIRSTKTDLALELARREVVDGKLQYSRLEINLAAALLGDPRHNIRLRPFDSLIVYCP